MNHLKQISLNTKEKYSSWSSNYGTLLSADGTNIADALPGVPQGFKFIAENTIDADSAIVLINVAKSSNTLTSKQTINKTIQSIENTCAPGELKIENDECVCMITEPAEGMTYDDQPIQADPPQMPSITCKAKLVRNVGPVTFNWKFKIAYELPTREANTTFTGTEEGFNDQEKSIITRTNRR